MARTDVTVEPNIVIDCKPSPRLRRRRVAERGIALMGIVAARKAGHAVVMMFDGGSVGNNYGYKALTEGALVIAWPHGDVLVRVIKLPANKVTDAGIASTASPPGVEARAIFDGRYSQRRRAEVRERLVAAAERRLRTGAWLVIEPSTHAVLVKAAASGGLFRQGIVPRDTFEAAPPLSGLTLPDTHEDVI